MHPELHIQEKLNQQLQKAPPMKPRNLWVDISVYSIVIFIILSLYLFVREGSYTLSSFNRASANVGVLFIGLSFILSGLCYFWNFADHFIIYRKQLGVTGFAYAVIHALVVLYDNNSLAMLIPKSITQLDDIALISSEIAVFMYATMIIISTKTVVHEIGGQRWRQLLRVGYVAVVLSLIHMFINSYQDWLLWLTGNSPRVFPSLGLLVFIFGIAVVIMRITLWIALLRKTSTTTLQQPQVPASASPSTTTPPVELPAP